MPKTTKKRSSCAPKNSGKYSSVYKEVSTLYAAGEKYDLAIEFLKDFLKSTKDPGTISEVEEQLKYLYVEKNIQLLQNLVDRYVARYNGMIPPNLDVFVDAKFIKKIPEEPFGGKYILTKDGKVRNEPYKRFEHYQNMRDYIPEHGMRPENINAREEEEHDHEHEDENDPEHDHEDH